MKMTTTYGLDNINLDYFRRRFFISKKHINDDKEKKYLCEYSSECLLFVIISSLPYFPLLPSAEISFVNEEEKKT